MSLIKYSTKEITCKIVYYGPGRSGKTTNLQYIYLRLPSEKKTEMVSLATEKDRTLFFDFLPIDIGHFGGFKTRFQLYTVPGQVYYDSTRTLVLQGADGVVFVADSQKTRFEDNIESFENLKVNLLKNGYRVGEIPIVLQYNKRDLQDIVDIETLQSHINQDNYAYFESIAIQGKGVIPAFKEIGMRVLEIVRMKMEGEYR